MATIYRTQGSGSQSGFEFDTGTGIVRNMRGATASLGKAQAEALAFTCDLLEKYDSTDIGQRALRLALATAFGFWED